MLEIVQLVSEPRLQEVPLCVVHPVQDEIIPLSHGQAVLRAAASDLKYGIWPPHTGHNDPLTSDQLLALRIFLAEHMVRCGPSCPANVEQDNETGLLHKLGCCWQVGPPFCMPGLLQTERSIVASGTRETREQLRKDVSQYQRRREPPVRDEPGSEALRGWNT